MSVRRQHGGWVRQAVLGRLGGLPEAARAELLSARDRDARIAGVHAAAVYGSLGPTRALAIAATDPDHGVRLHALRVVMSAALAPGRRAELDRVRPQVLAQLHTNSSYDVRRKAFTTAVETGFLRPSDLAELAVTHRTRYVRHRSCAAVLAAPDGNAFLDRLLSARDPAVRTAALARLRGAGRGEELVRHLADVSPAVLASVCRELRAVGDDPRVHYRALCADPAAVTPAAAVGLAEQRRPEDATLLRSLTRHPAPDVRARARSGLRILGDVLDDEPSLRRRR
ncbi:hypothetical protein [Streptomyces sp. NPDC060194]|uniref:hypothetical protein n=1 Tax=Streptomyces sp. NPDC060194 TaxID=3347069 RepID=UPI003667A507